jgi:hypothetical protein
MDRLLELNLRARFMQIIHSDWGVQDADLADAVIDLAKSSAGMEEFDRKLSEIGAESSQSTTQKLFDWVIRLGSELKQEDAIQDSPVTLEVAVPAALDEKKLFSSDDTHTGIRADTKTHTEFSSDYDLFEVAQLKNAGIKQELKRPAEAEDVDI